MAHLSLISVAASTHSHIADAEAELIRVGAMLPTIEAI